MSVKKQLVYNAFNLTQAKEFWYTLLNIMEGENQPPERPTLKDIAVEGIRESVIRSIEGQKPSWINALSRKLISSTPRTTKTKSRGYSKGNPKETIGVKQISEPAEYQIGNFNELLDRDGISSVALDALYGSERPNVSFIELDETALQKLDKDVATTILSRNNLAYYQNIVAFAMKAGHHEGLLTAMRMALEIETDVQLPVVVVRKGASIIPKAHELTHATKAEINSDARSLHDYINNPEEREAFLNSILVYRLTNPSGSFFDFAREQESVSSKEFPDEEIQDKIVSGKGKYLGLQKQMWDSINLQIEQGTHLNVDNLSEVKRVTQNQIEKAGIDTFAPKVELSTKQPDSRRVERREPKKPGKRTSDPIVEKQKQLEIDISQLKATGQRAEILGKAKELYELYIDIDPVYAAYRLGQIYEELQDADNAKKYYQVAIGYGQKDYFFHKKAEEKLSGKK